MIKPSNARLFYFPQTQWSIDVRTHTDIRPNKTAINKNKLATD